jgi:hypothetical protein
MDIHVCSCSESINCTCLIDKKIIGRTLKIKIFIET